MTVGRQVGVISRYIVNGHVLSSICASICVSIVPVLCQNVKKGYLYLAEILKQQTCMNDSMGGVRSRAQGSTESHRLTTSVNYNQIDHCTLTTYTSTNTPPVPLCLEGLLKLTCLFVLVTIYSHIGSP